MIIKVDNTEENIEIINKLASEIYEEHYSKLLDKEFVLYWINLYQSITSIKKSIGEGEIYYLLKENNKNIGYFSYKLAKKELFISKLYLKSEYRQKGYGKSMLLYIFKIAKSNNSEKIILKTMRKNPTVEFYKNFNFEIEKSVETDLGNGHILEDYVLTCTKF